MGMFKRFIIEPLIDSNTGKFSQARIISMLVAVAATIFIWKLILLGGMSVEYFIAYLAYGTGHQTLNKFLDNRSSNQQDVNRTTRRRYSEDNGYDGYDGYGTRSRRYQSRGETPNTEDIDDDLKANIPRRRQ